MYRSLKTFYVFRVDWKAIYGRMFNYSSYWKGKKVTCYAADPLVLPLIHPPLLNCKNGLQESVLSCR